VRLPLVGSLSTAAAGGLITPIVFNCAGITTCTDWAAYASLFDSFVIHGFSLQLINRPNAVGNDTQGGNLVCYVDMDGTTPATTTPTALEYASSERLRGDLDPSGKYTRAIWIPKDRRPIVNSTAAGFSGGNSNVSIITLGDNYLVPSVVQYFTLQTFFVEFQDSR